MAKFRVRFVLNRRFNHTVVYMLLYCCIFNMCLAGHKYETGQNFARAIITQLRKSPKAPPSKQRTHFYLIEMYVKLRVVVAQGKRRNEQM